MKKRFVKRFLALGLAGALLLPSACAVDSGSSDDQPQDNEPGYDSPDDLSQTDQFYIDFAESFAGSGDSANSEGDLFFRELSELLGSEDSSGYFDKLELTVGSSSFTVDGMGLEIDAGPEINNGQLMLPIQMVTDAVGADVDFDAGNQTMVITSAYGDEISYSIGSEKMMVNDTELTMDAASYMERGTAYLPIQAMADSLALEVEWDQDTHTVTLTAPYQSARVLVWADDLDVAELGAERVLQDGTGLWVLQFATPVDAKAAAEALRAQGITADGDLYIPPMEDEEDESFGITAAADSNSWGVEDCNFDTFIADYSDTFTGSGVVAVVDTGVDSSHPFLAGRVLTGRDFIDGDDDPDDEQYHGTHVAGTIIDCVGDAPVSILPVRVLNQQGSGTMSGVAAGVKYAADQGAEVINLSLGGGHSSVLDAAIQYAVNKGSLVVVAAGNDNKNTTTGCPAHMTDGGVVVISAGSSDHKKASFSNYGDSVDLMAPGVSILSSVPGGEYKKLNGTSMATPHAAAAAILLDLAADMALTPEQLEAVLCSATTNGAWTDRFVGFGFLDLMKADLPATEPAPSPDPEPTPAPTSEPTPMPTVRPTPTPAPDQEISATLTNLGVNQVTSNTARVVCVVNYSGGELTKFGLEFRNLDREVKDVSKEFTVLSDTGGQCIFVCDLENLFSDFCYVYHFYVDVGGTRFNSGINLFRTHVGDESLVEFKPGEVSNITTDGARIDCSLTHTGKNIREVGIYLGTSESMLLPWASEWLNYSTEKSVDTHFDLDNLSPGVTYYYQLYAVVGGASYSSDVRSFTTSS